MVCAFIFTTLMAEFAVLRSGTTSKRTSLDGQTNFDQLEVAAPQQRNQLVALAAKTRLSNCAKP